jgi:transposase-like protein
MKKEYRYHCNSCNTSFSVTVGTVFHKTKVDYQKWFLAILLMLNAKKRISARQLASDVQVNKNTACHMLMHIRKTMSEDPELLKGLLGADDLFRTILQRAVE